MDAPLSSAEPAGSPDAPARDTMDRIRRVFIASLHLNVRAEDLLYQHKLDEAAGLDSIAVLEFVAALEKEFGIEIEPEFLEIDFLRDLPRLASHIEDLTGRRSGSPS